MDIKCRNCGAAIADGVTICPYCDSEITFEAKADNSGAALQDISGISFELTLDGKDSAVVVVNDVQTIRKYAEKLGEGEVLNLEASSPINGIKWLSSFKDGNIAVSFCKNNITYDMDDNYNFEEFLRILVDFYEGRFNPNLEEEQLAPAQKLFDIGTIQNGALETFTAMCECINGGSTLENYIEAINNHMAKTNKDFSTNGVNADILRIAQVNVSSQIAAGEKPIFYLNNGIFSKGKDGFLVTDKAIYRIKKKGCAKVAYNKFHSLLSNGLTNHWYVNGDENFDLYCAVCSKRQFGAILGMICTIARDNNSAGYKITIAHSGD